MSKMSRNEFVRKMCRDKGIPEESNQVRRAKNLSEGKRAESDVNAYMSQAINRSKHGRWKR